MAEADTSAVLAGVKARAKRQVEMRRRRGRMAREILLIIIVPLTLFRGGGTVTLLGPSRQERGGERGGHGVCWVEVRGSQGITVRWRRR